MSSAADAKKKARVKKKRRNSEGKISKLLDFWKSVEKEKAERKAKLPPLRRRKKAKPKAEKKHQSLKSPLNNFNVVVTSDSGNQNTILEKKKTTASAEQPDGFQALEERPSRIRSNAQARPSITPPTIAVSQKEESPKKADQAPDQPDSERVQPEQPEQPEQPDTKLPPPKRRPSPVKPTPAASEPAEKKKETKDYLLDDEDCLAVFGLDEDEDEDEDAERGEEKAAPVKEDELTAEKKAKMAVKREQVEKEIISSEGVYVSNLQTLITTFIHPLKQKKDICDPSDILMLFSNIELLCGFHVVFLADLNKKKQPIHVTFQRMADFLKMYTQYVNGYENAMSTIHKLNKKKAFRKFLEEKQNSIRQGLMSFLIMPVQRIPRYVLLLKELIKNTVSTDPHIEPLRRSLAKVQDIAAYVNEQKRQMESRTTLLNIAQRLSNVGHFELFKPDRHLVKKGVLHTWHHRLTKRKEHHFMLFTDVVLWTTPTYNLEAYAEIMHVKIDEISAKPPSDALKRLGITGLESIFGFRLHIPESTSKFAQFFKGKDKPPIFFAEDAVAQKDWCGAIRETVSVFATNVAERRQRRINATARNMKQRRSRQPRGRSTTFDAFEGDNEPSEDPYQNLVDMKLDQLKKLKQRSSIKTEDSRRNSNSSGTRFGYESSDAGSINKRTLSADDFPPSPRVASGLSLQEDDSKSVA